MIEAAPFGTVDQCMSTPRRGRQHGGAIRPEA